MFRIITLIAGLLLNAPLWAGFEIEITQQQMQQMAEQQFPIQRKTLLADLELSHPKLSLIDQKFVLETTVLANFPNQTMSQGHAIIDGKLGYRAEKGEFLMIQPTLAGLQIEGLTPQGNQLLRDLASQLIMQNIQSIVVYRLDEKRFRDRMTKQSLKSVTIREGALYAEMEW